MRFPGDAVNRDPASVTVVDFDFDFDFVFVLRLPRFGFAGALDLTFAVIDRVPAQEPRASDGQDKVTATRPDGVAVSFWVMMATPGNLCASAGTDVDVVTVASAPLVVPSAFVATSR